MKKEKFYRYIGRNGIINSRVFLEGINYSLRYRLTADEGKLLTNGFEKGHTVEIDAMDFEDWYEIEDIS
jgi:hypothetical protein